MVMSKFTVDGPNRLLIANFGVTFVDVQVDLYSDSKEHWALTEDMKYPPPFRVIGGDQINPTKSFGAGYFLVNGWKIRPHEASHELLFDGNLFLDENEAGGIVVPTLGLFTVLATVEVTADARSVTSGSGVGNILGDFTVAAGATVFSVPTNATQAASFFDGQVALITSGSMLISRRIRRQASGGTFSLSPALPFVPSAGDNLKVMMWAPDDPIVVGSGVS